jgi:hypothetical protein
MINTLFLFFKFSGDKQLDEITPKFIKKAILLLIICTLVGGLGGVLFGFLLKTYLAPIIFGSLFGFLTGVSLSGYIAFWKIKG